MLYLQLTPFFPDYSSYKGVFIYDQVKAIETVSNYKVTVIKVVNSVFPKRSTAYSYKGIYVHQFYNIDLPGWIMPGLFNSWNLFRLKKLIKSSTNFDKEITIVHGHVTYPCGVLATRLANHLKAKSIIQHHGLDVLQTTNGRFLSGKLRKWNKAWFVKGFTKTIKKAQIQVGVSKRVLNELDVCLNSTDYRKKVLYNGVDRAKFYPTKKIKSGDDVFTIGCVGNFWPIKDQITLIKAVEICVKEIGLKNIEVQFIGEGETKQGCIDYVKSEYLNDFVKFLPPHKHEELNNFYNGLDLFVLPSYYEALGCVYLEAAACNIPVIGVNGQGIDELIPDSQKPISLIDPGDFQGLAEIIKLRRKRNKAGTNIKMAKLDILHLVKKYVDFINED